MEDRAGGADGGWADGRGAGRDWWPGLPHHPRPVGSRDRQAAAAAAFAEGRRLRDAAQARRRRQQQRAAGPRLSPPLAFNLAAVWLAMGVLAATGRLVLSMLVLLLAAWTAVVITHRVSRSLRGQAAGIAPLPGRRAAPPRSDVAWAQARSRFDRFSAEYAAYECDPISVLGLPALADVTVPSTGRFVEALAEAQALATDVFPGPDAHVTGFVAAVERADRAWQAARAAAERIRLSGRSPTERGTVERVIKLLTTARDSDSDAERLAAYSRARSELAKLDRAGVVHVPRPAQAALDRAARGELPA
jgi:hypothetical protein